MIAKKTNDHVANRGGGKISHNLVGQRLGRKGQETRERILTTAVRLIETSPNTPITLSAVAREASVGMTTLYLYFPDLGDLLLAVLIRVMDSADAAFVDQLRTRWPDETLMQCSADFLRAHHQFWVRHARILQLRNSYADGGDLRFIEYRTTMSRPLVELLIRQMDAGTEAPSPNCDAVARVLLIEFEYLATVVTNSMFYLAIRQDGITGEEAFVQRLIQAKAEEMALAIAHQRQAAARAAADELRV